MHNVKLIVFKSLKSYLTVKGKNIVTKLKMVRNLSWAYRDYAAMFLNKVACWRQPMCTYN